MPTSLDLDYRLFSLESSAEEIDAGLARGTVLLNCAGPYHQTAGILIDACIRNGIHYLDISAELDSYETAASRNEAAIHASAMLLPGCGGSVAMLGRLAGLTIASVVDPVSSISECESPVQCLGGLWPVPRGIRVPPSSDMMES